MSGRSEVVAQRGDGKLLQSCHEGKLVALQPVLHAVLRQELWQEVSNDALQQRQD